ncbi:type IX secretion system periplasmic lipoprotein PorW/SprE [Capnocytophaga felis]|uniref:Gliding motility protein n=1 Tax=Capnocytophaga felis TaxID=2267611 RepID=A0A5M4B6H2_9FLAO|nr:tetratricopeptide repeat protein [Capnocytophaga felis]GET45213.1 gliding motility protein [Capnocytophaga felis]GET47624.1 gliding motility protein [Capnocytophaga felis]
MKKYTQYFTLVFVIQLFIFGCTPNANTYYNRQMQPIVTKYNVLFNGEEAFDLGLKELQEQYQDNFSEILPVEPIKMSGKIQLDGIENPNFERAEEKAIKTIQLHSMVFKGVQRNYKIDDAYVLLGKARYYNERFLPALEAFNHLLTNYGKSERIPEAAIWTQKTNLRLGKDKIAIEKLHELLSVEKLRKNDKAEAYATLGQAYINQEMYPNAAEALYLAGKYTKNNLLRGRYYFIAAQLYEKQKQRDSAVVAYEKVIGLNWKISRKLWMEAQAGKARNKDFSPEEKSEYLKYLTKLEKRYEHKDLLDVLYFTHASLIEENSKATAADFYRKSLKNNKENNPLKAKTHERLAEIFFEQKDYTGAYHHLDSTLAYIPEHTFERLYIERKKENLAKITELEYTVKQNDSIIRIAKLPKEEQLNFFQKHIDSLQKAVEQKQLVSSSNDLGSGFYVQNMPEQQGGKFYFYNPMAIAYGKQQFQQYWGNRALEDNWRWSSKEKNVVVQSSEVTENEENISDRNSLTAEFFIEKLPKSEEEIIRLEKDRNQALYQLGVLYRSKFGDDELAINRLEKLLKVNPDANLEVAALYELYKNYIDSDNSKSEDFKNQLLNKFPESDYASILKGNISSQQQKDQKAQELLEALTAEFESGKIAETLHRLEENRLSFHETAVAPKLEMLKADAVARLYGIESYRQVLEQITMNYPETEESKLAKELLEKLSNTEKEEFVSDEKTKSWKVVIAGTSAENRQEIRVQLVEKLATISDKISVSEDIYNSDETWLVVHGLQNRNTAESIIEKLQEIQTNHKFTNFVIATENYRLVQIKKNKEKYFEYENSLKK